MNQHYLPQPYMPPSRPASLSFGGWLLVILVAAVVAAVVTFLALTMMAPAMPPPPAAPPMDGWGAETEEYRMPSRPANPEGRNPWELLQEPRATEPPTFPELSEEQQRQLRELLQNSGPAVPEEAEESAAGWDFDRETAESLGLPEGFTAALVADGLRNPAWVTFAPDGRVTFTDSGNGAVHTGMPGTDVSEWDTIDGFDLEFWKVNPDGIDTYAVGPLSAVWHGELLLIGDSGKPDGEERIQAYDGASGAAYGGAMTRQSNPLPGRAGAGEPLPEGNICGYSIAGNYLYAAGQGSDNDTWVVRLNLETYELERYLSADANGISINSPMQTMPTEDGTLLVLYSGTGGEDDGLIVEWDLEAGEPKTQWTLPGLVDPMGFARVAGTDNQFIVTDNNWALNEVRPGQLARVTLGADGGEAEIDVISDSISGPVHCAFDGNGTLYLTILGEEIDQDYGAVYAIRGF